MIEMFRGIDGQWYLRIVAANGKTVLDSEGYSRKWNAKRAAKRVSKAFGGLRIVDADPS